MQVKRYAPHGSELSDLTIKEPATKAAPVQAHARSDARSDRTRAQQRAG